MKKVFSILLALLLAFTLISCGGNGEDPNKPDNGNGGGGTQKPSVPPTEIVIMHGAPHEIDPRDDNFSGTEKALRLKMHEEIEKELNVKIVYKNFPASAAWGSQRQNAIIQWSIADTHEADIYAISTIWMAELAKAEAISPISKWLGKGKLGENIDNSVIELTNYRDDTWGFSADPILGERGLFYNIALVEEAGLEDPVELWNNGEWTWSKFRDYTTAAKTSLPQEYSVLGSNPSLYAESLLPLNGSSIVDGFAKTVQFVNNNAIEVYTFLEDLYARDLFEEKPNYDTGSEQWQNGEVLFHPGSLWFVRASNRWGSFEFVKDRNIGVVPFPMPDGKDKSQYKIPVGSEAVYALASTSNSAKEELAFEVWNRIQLWETEEERILSFEDKLQRTFDHERHIDVYLEIYNKTYFDIHQNLGIATYGGNAWQSKVNTGVKDRSTRSLLEGIVDTYREALDDFLGR